ncbi:MAG: ATP-binding cassette domain-containing protein [Erysipelotrichaceae bacterium]|nr:ATP-binding cassette domain-containing protein [Erysipelotrichaceae bacterium]MDY6034628.1 ATP-binding cassette domain-containing protein [Bulleidia sp.]
MKQIKLENIVVEYPLEDHTVRVMDNLNLELDPQRITVILGKSGCGKTTLLRLLKGFVKPTHGHLEVDSTKLSYVFQEPRLLPWLTVWQNITFFLKEYDKEQIQKLIDVVHLTGYENAYPSQLSGGMQSRVALARGLVYQAEYILMDEPFAALDDFTRVTMQKELLNALEKRKIGVLFVTHSIDEALTIAQDILVMDQGKVISSYRIEEKERDLLDPKFIDLKRKLREDIWR